MLKIHRAVFKAREKELKPLGITLEQCEVLYTVKHLGKEGHPAK